MKRILVTGSRDWGDLFAVERALVPHGPLQLVHGGARGLDRMADFVAVAMGWPIPERHPANWDRFGKQAGRYRNQAMVDRGADACLAFPGASSIGTYDCAARCDRAGIRVVWFPAPGVTESDIQAGLVRARRRL